MTDKHNADTAEFPVVEDVAAKHFGVRPPPVRVKFGALASGPSTGQQ